MTRSDRTTCRIRPATPFRTIAVATLMMTASGCAVPVAGALTVADLSTGA